MTSEIHLGDRRFGSPSEHKEGFARVILSVVLDAHMLDNDKVFVNC